MTEFLLEIGTEEMPPSHLRAGLAELRQKLEAQLRSCRIGIKSLRAFGTCRRLAVWADLSPGQEDKEEVVVGPPRAVAFAPDGTPTAAARGFAKAQETEVERLEVITTPRGEYVALRRVSRGRPTKEILAEAFPGIIVSLSFPKTMRWEESGLRFSRPIRNILCLWGGKVLPFSLAGLKAGPSTTGHRLLNPQRFSLGLRAQRPSDRADVLQAYISSLRKRKVIPSGEERKSSILAQIKKKLAPLGAELYPDEELLDALADDVEHPYVFLGEFPKDYLRLPIEVVSVAMREGQKLFSVVKDGRQVAKFLGVADTTRDPKGLIRKGNERVLKARLDDAKFFWEQDLKIPLAQRAEGLKQVIFQAGLGTYEHKRLRLKELCSYLCEKADQGDIKKDVVQAADLAKIDLLTEMVREFPSLQGKVGGLYAKAEGYSAVVWRAVYEHYRPVGLEDEPPATVGGAILSIADKTDSIVGSVGRGVEITGSSDPFGLRRNANGVCKVILDKRLDFSFSGFVAQVILGYEDIMEARKSPPEITDCVLGLFEQRLRFLYEAWGFRYDIVSAALGAGLDNIHHTHLRVKALDGLRKTADFEPFVLMAKRVNNILRDQPSFELNPDLLEEKEEKELYSMYSIVRDHALPMLSAGDYGRAQGLVFRIRGPLSAFFDRILVMAEDRKIRQNRLALLQEIRDLLSRLADFSRVVVEGEKKEASA